jgi:glycosyltransferase involved in cell wall biosynthesis
MNENCEYRFTVLTPTYNRAHTLLRVYESLKRQTFRDFEWLIIDDGSTDNTKELVEKFQEDNFFHIHYFRQENAHKKTAFNRGVKEAKGQFFLTLDSDDEALPDALEIFNRHWCRIPENQREIFSAVTGLCVTAQGKIVGDKFPEDVFDSDSLEVRYRYRNGGEKWGFHRTAVLRKFPFPENVQGFVPESVVWSAIASRYKTRFVNDAVRVYHTEADSLSTQSCVSINADGQALWAREALCNELHWFRFKPLWFFYVAANYTRFHLHLNKKQPGKHWPLNGKFPKFLVFFMWPVGVVRYYYDALQEY